MRGGRGPLRQLFSSGGTSRVVIDPINKRLAVHSRRRDLNAPLDKIEGLRLRKILYPGGLAVNGERVRYLLLEAAIQAGQPMPLHAFKWQAGRQEEVLAVAHRAQSLLAGLIRLPGRRDRRRR